MLMTELQSTVDTTSISLLLVNSEAAIVMLAAIGPSCSDGNPRWVVRQEVTEIGGNTMLTQVSAASSTCASGREDETSRN
jgi:hypothetical protein